MDRELVELAWAWHSMAWRSWGNNFEPKPSSLKYAGKKRKEKKKK
jgi:hypothetical protein